MSSYNVPIDYTVANATTSKINPAMLHVTDTVLYDYFFKSFFERACGIFTCIIPDSWYKPYVMCSIMGYGYGVVFNTDKYGVQFQQGTPSGYGIQYQPTNVLISNPLIKNSIDLRIGIQCETLYIKYDYTGIVDIVSTYAALASMLLASAGINLQNTHVAYLYGASGKAKADTVKGIIDNIMRGDPVVVYDRALVGRDGKLKLELFNRDIKSTYITPELLIDFTRVVGMFDEEIGIPSANTTKKERLIQDEVNSNNIATYTRASLWLENLQECCKRVNKMFFNKERKLWFDWRFKPDESDTIDSGDVQRKG